MIKTPATQTHIEWMVICPDTRIHDDPFTADEIHASSLRSAICNPGLTSHLNVGHFMATVIIEPEAWNQWKGQMPVIDHQAL